MARLRREIADLDQAVERLHPDYDSDEIVYVSIRRTARQNELIRLSAELNRKDL